MRGAAGGGDSDDQTLIGYMYWYLFRKYGNHQTVLLNMYGLISAVEKAQAKNTMALLVVRALSGDLDDATWHCSILLSRSLSKHAQRTVRLSASAAVPIGLTLSLTWNTFGPRRPISTLTPECCTATCSRASGRSTT